MSVKWLAVLLGFTILYGCASSMTPSSAILVHRADMTPAKADLVLNKYLTATPDRGGLCLMGFNPGAKLDYTAGTSAEDGQITFNGLFGKGHILGKALPLKDKPYGSENKTITINAKALREVRVISENVDRLRQFCPNLMPSYLVVIKPKAGMPADSEASINVNSDAELNELVAVLTWLSPDARMVGGVGI